MVFGRLKTGIMLTIDSIKVLKNNPKLLIFPLLGLGASLGFLVTFLGVTFGLVQPEGGALVVIFLIYLGTTFISSFFTAALVHEARDAIRDGIEPSLRDGFDGAWEVKGPILIWSLISATVGILLNVLENSNSPVGRIMSTLFSVGWTLMTFFVIPVIVFEKAGTKQMFTDSARTFKQTWGETPISLIGVRLIPMLIVIPTAILAASLANVSGLLAIGTFLSGILLAFLIGQTLQGIVKTTLYIYATEGKKPDEFNNVAFDTLNGQERRQQERPQYA